MHAVIVGCGRVGAELAQALEAKGGTVSIIDRDGGAFEQRLHPGFHGKKLVGIGFDREILEEAGIKEADIFVSATRGDNTNIVSARIAKEFYATPNVAALIYDPRRVRIYERLGIATVASVAWATDQLLSRVLPSTESVEWTVGGGEVVVVGIPAPIAMIGQPIDELREPGKVSVVALTRFGATQIPDRKTVIQEGDFIHLSVLRTAQDEVDERLKGPAH
ncbi:MAG: TrkA family potassium uptake protein [Actinomycetota bacterium]